MSDWITTRKPTASDGNSNEDVWVCYANGEVFSAKWWSAAAQDKCVAWKCKERTPETYVSPQSKRSGRKHWIHGNGHFKSPTKSIEILPSDPPDLDEFLAAFDEWCDAKLDRCTKFLRMVKARGER